MERDLAYAAVTAGALALRSATRIAEQLATADLQQRIARCQQRRTLNQQITTFEARAVCLPEPRSRRDLLEAAHDLRRALLDTSDPSARTPPEIRRALRQLERRRRALTERVGHRLSFRARRGGGAARR